MRSLLRVSWQKCIKNQKYQLRESCFLGGGSMYFHRRSLGYYFYYPTVQPRYDSSHLLIILLLWNTAAANWRFLRWLLSRGSDFFAHLLFVIMRSCSAWRSVTQKDFTGCFYFFLLPPFFNKSWRYFKQGPARFLSAILFQQKLAASAG